MPADHRSRILVALSLVLLLTGCTESAADRVARLREDLGSGDAATRRQAVLELGQLGPEAAPAVPELVATLADAELRFTVMATLGRVGTAALPELVAGLGKPELAPHVRSALHTFGESVLPDLVELGRGPDSANRRLAIAAILELGPSATAGLCQLAEDPKLRDDVAWGLQRIKVEYLRALLVALGDASEEARRFVIPRIWQGEPVPGEPNPLELMAALESEEAREGTAIGLAAMGPRILPKLIPALGFAKLRKGARYAIELMGKAALPALREAREPARGELATEIDGLIAKLEG